MYHGEVSIPNKEVTLDTDCGSESSIKEKHGHSNTNHIYACHCIYYENNRSTFLKPRVVTYQQTTSKHFWHHMSY